MINDPFHPEEALEREKETSRRMWLGIVCAVALSAILLTGYGYFRNRHAQQVLKDSAVPVVDNGLPKGPPLAHVLIDEPSLERGMTTIGGTVKNISERDLSGLSVSVELIRRKDGSEEQKSISLQPSTLPPDHEALYSLKVSAHEYGSIRFVGVKADPQSTLIACTTAPGKKRSLERLEPRTVVTRSGRTGEFINTPENPGRVP
jgi:hypothetical protein